MRREHQAFRAALAVAVVVLTYSAIIGGFAALVLWTWPAPLVAGAYGVVVIFGIVMILRTQRGR
mgnify:CR=1 FL=1